MSNLNSIYPIYNHLCQPSSHHNHPDKLLIQTMIQLLSQHTSPLAHQKICTNLGILGNEAADKLAKFGANPLQTYPPPPHATFINHKKRIHVSTYPLCEQRPLSITSKQPDTIKLYGIYINYSSATPQQGHISNEWWPPPWKPPT